VNQALPLASAYADASRLAPTLEEAHTSSPPKPKKRPRDPRLDTFRGIGMFIILIAHIPGNSWTNWIPARFGFSDATEIFVFCSGMASALAFGRLFDRHGFALGIGRIAHRIWQVYWAHIGIFVVVTSMLIAAGAAPDGEPYVDKLNLEPFLVNPGPLLLGLATLRYVPNYFDILPMYLVILAMLPFMLALERVNKAAPFIAMAAIWMLTQFGFLDLPAEPWSDRPWLFDPFGWQLLFFLGFFIMRGTLRTPGFSKRLVILAVATILAAVPFAYFRILDVAPALQSVADAIAPLTSKSHFGFLRLPHFLAIAYLAAQAAGPRGSHLGGTLVKIASKVGQQTLAVFISGMVLAQALGILLDRIGHSEWAFALANILGLCGLVAVAYAVGWFKSTPWKAGES
jgi:hypothetical protein